MKEFICTGSIELRGVQFFIKAETLEEAKKKAEEGEFESFDSDGADTTDWHMNPRTVEVNE